MFARFDKNPAMTFQDIKETKRYRRTHAHTDVRLSNFTCQSLYCLHTQSRGIGKASGENIDLYSLPLQMHI